MNKNYDFCGWVTKNDLECSDGRIIKRNAFAHQDGERVPLAWNHNHDTPEAVLGYTILENRPEGVYGYSYLNDTKKANDARILVQHGDIDSYSIYANHLKQTGPNVFHGDIKEVSLVFSGANPGAYIEDVSFAHSEDGTETVDEAIIYTGDTSMAFNDKFLSHNSEESVMATLDGLTDEQKAAVDAYVNAVVDTVVDEIEDSYDDYDEYEDEEEYDEDEYEDDEDDSEDESDDEEVEHSDYEGDNYMKHNVFDEATTRGNVLTHSDFEAIKASAKQMGSMKEAYHAYIEEMGFAHADGDYDPGITPATGTQTYGFNDPEMLFPDYKTLQNTPDWIKRDDSWVNEFWGKVHRVPFARIKSLYADITEDAARAKGYITKGAKKTEEVFKTMKRVTDPTTVYKKQKLDKQDIDDITDFDVVVWIRAEMRIMLNEEIARAALIGDGRSNSDPDKIDDTKIRPVYLDDDFYVIRYEVDPGNTPDEKAKNFIRACVKARKTYKGSGNTTMFTTEDLLTDCLLVEDNIGHRLYKTEAELCSATRTSKISTVEVMEGVVNPNNDKPLAAIILNPKDYTVGANKGGNIDMFDDFDIDYNQFKYLLETRCSGALTKWKSAIVLEFKTSSNPSQG